MAPDDSGLAFLRRISTEECNTNDHVSIFSLRWDNNDYGYLVDSDWPLTGYRRCYWKPGRFL